MGTKTTKRLENSKENFRTFRGIMQKFITDGNTPKRAFKMTVEEFQKVSPSGHPVYMKGRNLPYKESTLRHWAQGIYGEHGHNVKLAEPLLPVQIHKKLQPKPVAISPVTANILAQTLVRIEEKLDRLLERR